MPDAVQSTLHSNIILVLATIEFGVIIIPILLSMLPKVVQLGSYGSRTQTETHCSSRAHVPNYCSLVLLKLLGAEILLGSWL